MSRTDRGGDAARPEPVLLLADDLSGAAESALAHGGPSTLLLDAAVPAPGADVLVVDLDSRAGSAAAAAAGLRRALQLHTTGPGGRTRRVALKVDSLLRGHLAAVVATASATGAPVVVAPALPVTGRTVRGGIVHVHGTPLHRTDAWGAEGTAPPVSVAAALGHVPARVLDVALLRSGDAAVAAAIAGARAAGAVLVCDAEQDADLDAVVRGATAAGAVLVGSAGALAALGRTRTGPACTGPACTGPTHTEPARTGPPAPGRDVLVVVGTAAASAREQVALLHAAGAALVELGEDAATTASAVAAALRGGCAVLTLPAAAVDPARSRRLVSALAAAVRAGTTAHPGGVDLVLTGGETARRVLDALGVRVLEPLVQVHHGAVVSRAGDGRLVATRPGSFGGPDSLLALARALGALPPPAVPHPDASPTRQEISR